MYNKKIKYIIINIIKIIFIIILLTAFFTRPNEAFESIRRGLNICYYRLIPSLFPFFIISGFFMASPLANWGGFIFNGYLKILGIKSKKASTGMLLGLLGGFAGAGAIISTLYNDGEISKNEAELLLCATASSGPAFVINTVGFGMLGSSQAGVLMYFSIFLSNLATGAFMRLFIAPQKNQNPINCKSKIKTAYEIIQTAVNTMITLCGFVTAFTFFSFAFMAKNPSLNIKYLISTLMEVTIGCDAAASMGEYKIYFVIISLSTLGICAAMQLQIFCKEKISIKPYIISRIVHVGFSISFLFIMLKIFPISLATSSFYQDEIHYKLPVDTFIVFFLMLAAFFCDLNSLTCLRKQKNNVYYKK